MNSCPVCYSQIYDKALRCQHCKSFIKPRINEGQFWGTLLMVAGILVGFFSYIWFLSRADSLWLQTMNAGVILAYLGFLVYGFGTFQSWFSQKPMDTSDFEEEGKKRCFYCGSIIDSRAIKCPSCQGYLRQERGKILATFAVVSGILIMTTAYIVGLAKTIYSEMFMQVGFVVIVTGILLFMLLALRKRYSSQY
ncbi:MAG: hypothetical protein FVQ81_06405 [Candidatus Glassbacteria bacterium]|nr:hypothetical protein [Candidatus Glassbacteria bacterium]